MVGKIMDTLIYLGLGALVAELVDVAAVRYADPRPGMNVTMLGAKAGKPSVYIPGATGLATLTYAAYQGDKNGRLDEMETALIGYGIFASVKTAGKILAPATTAPATSVKYAPGGVIPRQMLPDQGGYPAEANGSRRGAF